MRRKTRVRKILVFSHRSADKSPRDASVVFENNAFIPFFCLLSITPHLQLPGVPVHQSPDKSLYTGRQAAEYESAVQKATKNVFKMLKSHFGWCLHPFSLNTSLACQHRWRRMDNQQINELGKDPLYRRKLQKFCLLVWLCWRCPPPFRMLTWKG